MRILQLTCKRPANLSDADGLRDRRDSLERLPVMRQQCCDVACAVGRQAYQNVLDMRMRFVAVELR